MQVLHLVAVDAVAEDQCDAKHGHGRDARNRGDGVLLVSARPKPEIALETHDILRNNVSELKDGRFEVVQIDPIREDGAVLYYAVTVKK